MKKLLKQTLKISVLLLAIFYQGCKIDDAPLPEVIAGFTYTLNEDTGTVTFINISTDAGTYSWTFGDGESSTEINPIYTYASGSYTVTLEASNVAGGSGTFEDTIVISIPELIALPITFDEANVAYDAATFNGTAFEIVDNPDVSGTNDKASNVGEITNIGAAFEGFNFDLGTPIDLSADNAITMNFWAEAAVDILVKLEEGTGSDAEITSSHGGTGWENLSFTFNSSSEYSRLTIFVDGPGETAGTFYIDDIMQSEAPPAPCTSETIQSLDAVDFNLTFLTDPGAAIGSFDAVLTTVSNPDSDNAVNSSCQVGQIDRNGGALFANNQIEFDTKLDFNANSGFKMKVWSPVAGTKVLVKLEDQADAGIFAEVEAVTTTSSEWEELTFPFASGESDKYDKIILFFELNTNTTQTYYIDDFALFSDGGTGGGECTAETTQSLSPADFNLTFQTDPGSSIGSFDALLTSVANPDFDNAVNSSCQVGQIDRDGSALFANNQIEFDAKLDFNTNTGFTMKVWSPNAGTNVLVKLEDQADAGSFTELSVATTKAGEWEELTYPFATSESGKYDLIILFFELNTNTTETYYIDDFKLVGTGVVDTEAPAAITDLAASNTTGSTTALSWMAPNDNIGVTAYQVFRDGVSIATTGAVTTYNVNGLSPLTAYAFTVFAQDAAGNVSAVSNTVNITTLDGTAGDGNLAINGDFETGNTSGWEITENNGSFDVTSTEAACGNFSGRLVADIDGGTGGPSFPFVKQANIGIGTVTPNSQVTISFDLRGSLAGIGGVVIAEFFSENSSGGTSASEILGGGPLTPTDIWTRYSYTVTTGSDVSAGVTLLLKSECGPVAGCAVDAYFDNVFIGLGSASGPDCEGTGTGGNGAAGLNFEATSVSVNEADGTATFAARLNGDVSGGFTVDYATADGSAVQPGDYSSTSGTLTFAGTNGESYDIVVPIIDDVLDENGENFVVNLSNISNTTITINTPQATGNISDNDGVSSELAENGGFESGNLDGWAVFTNNGSITVDNTDPSSGAFSATLVATPTGQNPTLKQERKGAGTLSVGDQVKVTFDYKGSLSGIGGVYSIQSFVEATNGVNQVENFSVTPTSAWQTFTTTYTVAPGDIAGGITMEFVAICGGDPATNCISTLSIDSVSIEINP